MATAGAGRDRARGGAGRWVWGAVVALFAAFAVLLHHETAAHGDDGPCSGMGVQHCSAAGIDVVKHMPPSEPWVGREGDVHAIPAGRPVPGTVRWAPPDLSVLSRLLL